MGADPSRPSDSEKDKDKGRCGYEVAREVVECTVSGQNPDVCAYRALARAIECDLRQSGVPAGDAFTDSSLPSIRGGRDQAENKSSQYISNSSAKWMIPSGDYDAYLNKIQS